MNPPVTQSQVLVSPAAEGDRFLPEGPRAVIVDGREALMWVNIQTAAVATSGAIHLRFWDTGELRTLPQSARPGFVLPTDRPGFVVAGREKEIGLLDVRTNSWTSWATIPDKNPHTIINDGEIVPGGNAIVFGTKDVRFAEPIGHLYLFKCNPPSPTRSEGVIIPPRFASGSESMAFPRFASGSESMLWTLADNQLCSNGKIFAQSGNDLLLYDIDTPKRNVVRYRFDLDQHRIEDEIVVLDLKDIEGFPDGMCDAGDGSVIIAFYNPARGGSGKAIRFWLSTGQIIEEWATPGSPRVTCPLLLNQNGKIHLVLTTAVEGMPPELRRQSPNAGNLFIAPTSIPSLPRSEVIRLI